MPNTVDVLVDVETPPADSKANNNNEAAAVAVQAAAATGTLVDYDEIGGATGDAAAVPGGGPVPSYQNQTAADIESGRSRVDSVGSYGSGGSEDALLPASSSRPPPASVTTSLSPGHRRATNRADRPLLSSGGSGGGHGTRGQYEEIEEDNNNFPGEADPTKAAPRKGLKIMTIFSAFQIRDFSFKTLIAASSRF